MILGTFKNNDIKDDSCQCLDNISQFSQFEKVSHSRFIYDLKEDDSKTSHSSKNIADDSEEKKRISKDEINSIERIETESNQAKEIILQKSVFLQSTSPKEISNFNFQPIDKEKTESNLPIENSSFPGKSIINNNLNEFPNCNIDFTSSDELLSSLDRNQIISLIESRYHSEELINLIAHLQTEKISEILDLICPKLTEIMITNNKFCQKLFEQCNVEQRIKVLTAIQNDFVDISFNKWGSFSLQSLIKVISLPEEQEIIKQCIKGKILKMSTNNQSVFVLQKIILHLNSKGMKQLIEESLIIFDFLITNENGINLLKNIIINTKSLEVRKIFIFKMVNNFDKIISNQSGHNLILQIIDKWTIESYKYIIIEIVNNICKYVLMANSFIIIKKIISLCDYKSIQNMSFNLVNSKNIINIVFNDYAKNILILLLSNIDNKSRKDLLIILKNNFYNCYRTNFFNTNPNINRNNYIINNNYNINFIFNNDYDYNNSINNFYFMNNKNKNFTINNYKYNASYINNNINEPNNLLYNNNTINRCNNNYNNNNSCNNNILIYFNNLLVELSKTQ